VLSLHHHGNRESWLYCNASVLCLETKNALRLAFDPNGCLGNRPVPKLEITTIMRFGLDCWFCLCNRRMPNRQGRNAARFQLIQNARQAIPSLKLQENQGEGLMIGMLAALLFILLCIPLLPGGLVSGVPGWLGHFSSTAGMALNATVAAGMLHLMLKHFPRCFTLGR